MLVARRRSVERRAQTVGRIGKQHITRNAEIIRVGIDIDRHSGINHDDRRITEINVAARRRLGMNRARSVTVRIAQMQRADGS